LDLRAKNNRESFLSGIFLAIKDLKPSQAKPSQAKPNPARPRQTKPNQTKPNAASQDRLRSTSTTAPAPEFR
jgi:hypothetical protein